jgi:cyanate permease
MATPPLIGRIVDLTHSFVPGLLLLAGVLVVAASLIRIADRGPKESRNGM